MPVRIEVIDQFFVKDFGTWKPDKKAGESITFPNYTYNGERELLVFDGSESSTTVFLAPCDVDEVDIEEKGIDRKKFKKLKTLKEGGEPLLRETASRSGKIAKVLRLSYVKKESIKPKVIRPLLN